MARSPGLTIGRLARAAGVGVETVRFYERQGLIERPPRPAGRAFRIYPEATIGRLRFIRRAQALGFSLREVRGLLALEEARGSGAAEVRAQARRKLREVEAKIAELERIRQALGRLIAECPGRGGLAGCSILGALAEPEEPGRAAG